MSKKHMTMVLVPDTRGQINHAFFNTPIPKGGFKLQIPAILKAHLDKLRINDPALYKSEMKEYRKEFK